MGEEPANDKAPERLLTLPKDQTQILQKMIGGKPKFYSRDTKDMAKTLLTSLIPKMTSKDLEKTQADAAGEEEKPLVAAPRNPVRAAARAQKQLILIAKLNLQKMYLLQAQKVLPGKAKKDIEEKIRNLPADTKPGSQQEMINKKIREEWMAAKTQMRDGVREAVDTFKREKVEILQLKLFKDLGVDDAMRKLNQQERKAADEFKAVSSWKLGRENLGNEAIASTTASLKADNLKNCPELKAMCEKDIRVRRQCPSTCSFVNEKKEEAVAALVEAEKMIAKKVQRKVKKDKKEYDVKENRLLVQKTKVMEDKEKTVKLKLKERALQKELGIVPVETNVVFSSDPVVEKQQKLDIKSKALTNKAMLIRREANKEIREGQKVLSKEDDAAKKQAETIKNAAIHTEVTKIVDGKPVAVKPNPVGNVIKAKTQGQAMEGELTKAVTLIKDGEKKMKESKVLLKQAVAFAKGELVKPAPVKPMPEVNSDEIRQQRQYIMSMEHELHSTSDADKKVTIQMNIDKAKKFMQKMMKGNNELGESNDNLSAVKRMYHAMITPEKYISFDNEQQCNYQPPAGCGCSSDVQGAQSDPHRHRKLLQAPNPNTSTGHNSNGDTTVLSGCPAMPADCHCEEERELNSMSLIQELQSGDDDFSDLGDSLDNMFGGIICRVRTALDVAKSHNPKLLSAVENGKVFTKYKKEIAPLLSCVQNSAKSDRDCSPSLLALMDDADNVMPAVKDLQHKLGSPYHKAVKKSCSKPGN